MEKIQLRLTADQADLMADALLAGLPVGEHAAEIRELKEQAARLNHLAAKARARAARAGIS